MMVHSLREGAEGAVSASKINYNFTYLRQEKEKTRAFCSGF